MVSIYVSSKFPCSYSGARSTETFARVKRGRQHVYHWSGGKYKKYVLHASEIKKKMHLCTPSHPQKMHLLCTGILLPPTLQVT